MFDPDTTTLQDARTGSIPTNLATDIITEVKSGSAIMKVAKAQPMTKPVQEFSFMSGIGAYWVDEGQKISTSKPTWMKGSMTAHKMGVIIPTSKENLKYSVTNFFDLMKAEIAEAFYKKFDNAVLTGNDNPFPQSVLGSAALVKQTVEESGNKYDDISKAMALLEAQDLDANAIVAPRAQKVKYRSTKDNNGSPIFNDAHSGTTADVLGLPISWTPSGSLDRTKVSEILADWNSVYYGILGGIEYEVLTEATLSGVLGEDGLPINLAERDMAAIKATFSPAFMVIKDEAVAAVLPKGTTATPNDTPARTKVGGDSPKA
ncbi:phage major capsid protein [Pediococcus acidilactici]|uniref:Phage capsid family n=1 Tax=Pediococcus acidilactici DSM 20284 TaxID=862514 RepID=E0NDB5_PEDAC|nr:phage major capsid protein [Pediococcus acidilactici]AZP90615.1 phage major capsid protein [Pediococcus acidilactici]EFL96236.1 putative phage capsid family [Pediococcus acidilactici DSM 20284]KRN17149.1 phage capsid family protein [Pediococcus acidilactici]MBM6602830.1 phage major capsid protein [Pediococcus acidilactici]MDG9739587.1 phage major capsid protein [Pediococcus acidilactici]